MRHTQLVRPELTHLIVYPGGFGGEFMAYWLGQHPGCVKSRFIPLQKNRYVLLFDQDFKIDSNSTCNDRLFLITHPDRGNVSFNGVPADQLNRCYLSCKDPAYRKFFFLLSWLKQRLFKFPVWRQPLSPQSTEMRRWSYHVMQQFTDDTMLNEFLKYIDHREWLYENELDSFKLNQPNLDPLTRAQDEYIYCELDHSEFQNLFTINIDRLMFDGSQDEHQRMCEHFGIDYEQAHTMLTRMYLYHQRNLALYKQYINVPIDDFISMSREQAWPHIAGALAQCHAEPVIV